jgi:hypothetical protein
MGENFSTKNLLGLGQTGGGLFKSRSRRSSRSKSMNMNMNMNMNSYLRGEYGGKSKRRSLRGQYGGDSWSCQSCTLVPNTTSNPIIVQPFTSGLGTAQSANTATSTGATTNAAMTTTANNVSVAGITGATMVGGSKKAAYKKRLQKYTTEKLHKIAASKNIKITKKKAGKTVYLKKSSIIDKLCQHKHGH